MEEMILQHIVFPTSKDNQIDELYYRKNNSNQIRVEESGMTLERNAEVSFGTYFNSITAKKWFSYTVIHNINLQLKLKGKFSITVFSIERALDRSTNKKTISTTSIDTQGSIQDIVVPIIEMGGEVWEDADPGTDEHAREDDKEEVGIYAFRVTALEGGCEIHQGAYITNVKKVNNAKLALIICTYKREEYVYNNMRILQEAFLNNGSTLEGKLDIYIIDNGNSLDDSRLSAKGIYVFQNKNTGGAGGFTRGLMEVINEKEKAGITHILLMDDDVVIQPEALYRTFALWSLIKEQYKNSFIGGAMLSQEEPWLQIEAGALWNAGAIISRKAHLDLRKVRACIRNEEEELCDYNAWWYCSFSVDYVREDNLPIPIFFRGDDVEFGLRNMKHLILLNGICVWHLPFDNKYSSSHYYYVHRNLCINNAVRGIPYSKRKFWREFFAKALQELLVFRYKNVELMIAGIEDYLKGIDWLKEQDGENLNKEVLRGGYQLVELEELGDTIDLSNYKNKRDTSEGKVRKIVRKLLLNGIFLSRKGDVVVSTINPHAYHFYRKARGIYYDESSNKGFITKGDRKAFFRLLRRMVQLRSRFSVENKRVAKEYRIRSRELMHLNFWIKYLDV